MTVYAVILRSSVHLWQMGFSPLSLKSRAAVVALHRQEDEVDHRAEDAPPRPTSLLCAPCSGRQCFIW